MKIGILTIHTAFNYGAMLQAFALQTAITKLGYNVQIIDYYPKDEEKNNMLRELTLNPKQIAKYIYARINPDIQKKIRRFNAFRNQMQLTQRYYEKNELYLNPPEFDVYIVGSDQMWNCERNFDSFMFLDFVNGKRKISYAPSFGTKSIPEEYSAKLKKHLSAFQSISVRENDGVNIIKNATGLKATQVLDPTFLLSKDDWSQLAAKPQFNGDYILVYGFSKSIEFVQLIKSVKERYKMPVVAIAIGIHFPFDVDNSLKNVGPLEFLALFRDAKVICTDSFHGLAFSIHFRKPFFTIPHPTRNSRLENLLNLLNLKKRQFKNPLTILDLHEDELPIDYLSLEVSIKENVAESLFFLGKNLN